MKTVTRSLIPLMLIGGLTGIALLPSSASVGLVAKTSHSTYALGSAKKCKVNYVKKTETRTVSEKVKGKTKKVKQRYVACVYKAPALKTLAPTTKPRASIDPSYTQDPQNPLAVTFTYFATSANGQLPNGVLTLHWGATEQSQVLAKSTNVSVGNGDDKNPLKTLVTFPSYGTEFVTVTYTSGTDSATQTDTEDIENPNPAPTTTTAPPPPSDTIPPATIVSGGGGGGGGGSQSPTTTTTVPPATTTTTAPPAIASSTAISVGSGNATSGYEFDVAVTDANGSVTPGSGSLTLTAVSSYTFPSSGGFQHPDWFLTTSSNGQTSCTLLFSYISNKWQVTSPNCGISQGWADPNNEPVGTPTLTVQAAFNGTSSDLASTSSQVAYS